MTDFLFHAAAGCIGAFLGCGLYDLVFGFPGRKARTVAERNMQAVRSKPDWWDNDG